MELTTLGSIILFAEGHISALHAVRVLMFCIFGKQCRPPSVSPCMLHIAIDCRSSGQLQGSCSKVLHACILEFDSNTVSFNVPCLFLYLLLGLTSAAFNS